MIRVDRGEEPPALRAARGWRLARAVLARQAGEEVEFVGYDAEGVRGALFTGQHHKCAYCEMPIQRDELPIEHFRPKEYAVRHVTAAGPVDRDRYWWLAWSWDNLFLVCSTCNGRSRKGNRFPLVEGTAPCAHGPGSPRVAPVSPADEQALFVDPGGEDPIDAIQFREQGGRWVPTGRASSARGLATVATFDTAFRARHGLALPRPGARPKPRAPVDGGADGLDDLPDALVWQVRAIGENTRDREPRLREALVALCRYRRCGAEALARYTRTDRGRVERALRALVAEGRLIEEQGGFCAPGGTGGGRDERGAGE